MYHALQSASLLIWDVEGKIAYTTHKSVLDEAIKTEERMTTIMTEMITDCRLVACYDPPSPPKEELKPRENFNQITNGFVAPLRGVGGCFTPLSLHRLFSRFWFSLYRSKLNKKNINTGIYQRTICCSSIPCNRCLT